MAYDEALADRIHQLLCRRAGYSQRKMFGGICFLLNGNMCCGVTGTNLMLRLGEKNAAQALQEPFTHEMDFTGKVMKSMIYVKAEGTQEDIDLKEWVNQAVKFVRTLPDKT
ncbi:TfoX/Sxy family protein [Gimesia benthica]|uniref:TfoX/Sxy family protein n=1 Tax=Gimesia benthica TaxID=2608982 RepID=A0A6I6A8I9_9PLAN|nr:TfoX/Sxy family protein [Gimesia benthica]QGQ21685.1 TfoX/Sxy family protein [Gimesia benthica]